MYLCLPQNLWKYELVWTSRLKIIAKIDDVTRWRKKDKKLRVTWLFFISLRMYAVLEETFYGRFVADSLRYPTEQKQFQIGFLFCRGIRLTNVTRWRPRNAMTMTFLIILFLCSILLYIYLYKHTILFLSQWLKYTDVTCAFYWSFQYKNHKKNKLGWLMHSE